MKRRKFLKASVLASSSLMVPSFLKGVNLSGEMIKGFGRKLVIIQLSGGNDGLNTVVPFRNDIYYKNRPNIAIQADKVLRLNDELGFNPAMEALRSVFDEGQMSIINSVGYPNPDRSHFRSMDIWHTASGSKEYLQTGWIGRYLDNNCTGCDIPYHALELDDSLSLAMKGKQKSGFAMSDPKALQRTTKNRFLKLAAQNNEGHVDPLSYLYKTMIDTQSSADYLYEKSQVHHSKVTYPNTPFAKDLRRVAELLTADTATQIYYVNLSGFDTHAFQPRSQTKLLQKYAEAMAAFVKDLQQNKLFDDTLIMTFSEFGRRVKQNASNGTDHGTANNLYLIGGKLKQAGFYNNAPDLMRLDKGDLRFEIDFRSVYTTVLEKWLEVDASRIIGGGFETLNVI